MGGDGLGQVAQCLFTDLHAGCLTIRCNAKRKFALAMLVEHGNQRDQPVLERGQGFLELARFRLLCETGNYSASGSNIYTPITATGRHGWTLYWPTSRAASRTRR